MFTMVPFVDNFKWFLASRLITILYQMDAVTVSQFRGCILQILQPKKDTCSWTAKRDGLVYGASRVFVTNHSSHHNHVA